MATVNKNFRIKQGLIVEGTTGTINGNNILTENGGDSYILNLVGGATLVKSVDTGVFNVDNAGYLTINANTFDAYGAADTAQGNAEDYADTVAGTAEQNDNSDTDTAINSLTTDDIEEGASRLYFSNTRAQDAIGAGTGLTKEGQGTQLGIDRNTVDTWYDAAGTAADLIDDSSSTTTNVWSAYKTSSEIDTAINNLVDGAPGLLNTLNEIAAAINDDENYFTTVTNAINAKQDALSAGDGVSIGNNTVSLNLAGGSGLEFAQGALSIDRDVVDGWYDAAGDASAAQTAAEGYADGLVNNVLDATTAFTAINLNDIAKEVAATATIATAGSANAISWSASAYKTAKALVKFETGTHSQVSEVLLTLDSSNNIAITEYAEVGTNGSLGTVSAIYAAGTIAITVTTAYANTDVTVKATLLV